MRKSSRLIIFFVPPEKIVNGGVMSIFSICKVSRQFKNIHKSEVVLSTFPGTKSYRKNDLFENDEIVYSFDELVRRGAPEFLIMHIPEYGSHDIQQALAPYENYLKSIPELKINILNQNILLMQEPSSVAHWFKWTPLVTQTTAHGKYATQKLADKYNLPTLHLSAYLDPEQYKHTPYEKKEDLIALSSDETELRDEIVNKLKKRFPKYKIVTIQNMRYEEYKDLVSRAKFTITFGEGFDGYYLETFFSGGITFAAYNEDFFPNKNFSGFDNIFSNYKDMLENITARMEHFENKSAYEKTVRSNVAELSKLYDFKRYTKNIENFYREKFTYLPSDHSAERLIGDVLIRQDEVLGGFQKLLEEKEKAINDQSKMIADLHAAIGHQDKVMQDILNSSSWKVTRPLRKASSALKKKRN